MTQSTTEAVGPVPGAQPGQQTEPQGDALDSGGNRNWWLLALGPAAGLVLALVLPASLSSRDAPWPAAPSGWRSGG